MLQYCNILQSSNNIKLCHHNIILSCYDSIIRLYVISFVNTQYFIISSYCYTIACLVVSIFCHGPVLSAVLSSVLSCPPSCPVMSRQVLCPGPLSCPVLSCPLESPKRNPKGSPKRSPKESPKCSPNGSLKGSTREVPRVT